MDTTDKFARLGLFDSQVPRYTSYPTAPHFKGGVGPETYGTWLESIPPGTPISLYVHIPFCRHLCWFCACRTQGTQSLKPVQAYLDVLLAELNQLAAHLPQGICLERLHWGGGTPTLLDADSITRLASEIAARFPFAPGYEFSVEIDPNEIDAERVDALRDAGMNRASIGVQDFDPDIQKIIGRIQSFEVTRDAIDLLRDTGIHSLNCDILYGLPSQSRDRLTASVQKLLSLEPDRVALYGYAHVPWMARRQSMIPSDTLPTPRERLALFETARRLFLWDGYDEIGIDHFAKPEDGLSRARASRQLKRNFQGYTDDTNDILIGLGASAISRLPQGYAQNNPATAKYTQAVRDGIFPISRGHAFQDDDTLRATIIERLMCDFEFRFTDVPASQQADAKALCQSVASQFGDVLTLTDRSLQIPTTSRALTRIIARAFDAYDLDHAGHSPAI